MVHSILYLSKALSFIFDWTISQPLHPLNFASKESDKIPCPVILAQHQAHTMVYTQYTPVNPIFSTNSLTPSANNQAKMSVLQSLTCSVAVRVEITLYSINASRCVAWRDE